MIDIRAYPPDGTDAGASFRGAFAAMHARGGILDVTPGSYSMQSLANGDFLGGAGGVTLRGHAGESEILVRSYLPLQIANVTGLVALQDLTFVGSPWDPATSPATGGKDCVAACGFSANGMTLFERCSFYGVGGWGSDVGANWGSVVRVHNQPAHFENCTFWGCYGEAGVVLVSQLGGATFRHCRWIDIGTRNGIEYSKVGRAGAGPWVRVRHEWDDIGSANEGPLVIDECTMDEGPGSAVIVDGLRVQHVDIRHLKMNVRGDGFGMRLFSVENVSIVGGYAGWSQNSVNAIELRDVGNARLRGMRCKPGTSANKLVADAGCRYLEVTDCEFPGGIDSLAQRTVVRHDGVELVT